MSRQAGGRLGKAGLAMLGAAVMLSMTACSPDETEARQVVEKAGSKITVMDNTSESVYTRLQLEGIDKVGGMRSMDWVDEDVIVVDKENRSLAPQMIEGTEQYPHNLYLHNLSTGGDTPLQEGNQNYGAAQVSPDKQYVFYKETNEMVGLGYIRNLESGSAVKVDEAPFRVEEGKWADDGRVVFPGMDGVIYRTDVQGAKETVVESGESYVHEVVESGGILYYVTGDNMELTAYDTDSKESKVLKQNVVWVAPSPDGSRLAVVKRTRPGEMVLVLCDSEGNEMNELASGQQVFGTSWSPDGSKLAYSLTAENPADDQNGVFITELESGEQTQLLSDIAIADQLRWSPSGKKLLASAAVLKDNKVESTTYVIRLSQP
ncbi:TolB family protein [Paenibacillus sp. FSL R7-0331]|uniref:TolB family protein n=1 Tax=Paenibacillus sp. FSL R7-0331 TaxID=1536773 RepID=UPI0004F63CC9|nr:PD40 domain-containing protein [Paenibacillus sp. FSL R7-0331]AIQ50323.1 lipoprotein [Paenibacillus sp. FSL R7-0331]